MIIEVFKYTGSFAIYYEYPSCKKMIKDSVKAIHRWNHPVKLDFTSVQLLLPEFADSAIKDLFQTLGYKKPKKFISAINGNDLVAEIFEVSLRHIDTYWREPRYRKAVDLVESNVI